MMAVYIQKAKSISILLAVMMALRMCESKQCETVDSCMCVFDDGSGTVDFTSIGNSGGIARFMDFTARDDSYFYSYNPCYSFSEIQCSNAAMCQIDMSFMNSFTTGDQSSADWSYDGQNIQIYYNSVTDTMRETFITATCDMTATEPHVEVQGETVPGSAQYFATIRTKCACADGCHTTIHVDVSVSLSGGSVLLIIAFVLIIVYLAAGVAFQRVRRQATGRELIPNSGFWGALPGLIKDGFRFTFSRCGRGGGGGSYQNI